MVAPLTPKHLVETQKEIHHPQVALQRVCRFRATSSPKFLIFWNVFDIQYPQVFVGNLHRAVPPVTPIPIFTLNMGHGQRLAFGDVLISD